MPVGSGDPPRREIAFDLIRLDLEIHHGEKVAVNI